MRFIRQSIVVHAHRWLKNGDHPLDQSDGISPGKIVQPYPRASEQPCRYCNQALKDHGYLDHKDGSGHSVVCPGDWIIGKGDGFRAIKPIELEHIYAPLDMESESSATTEQEQECLAELDDTPSQEEFDSNSTVLPAEYEVRDSEVKHFEESLDDLLSRAEIVVKNRIAQEPFLADSLMTRIEEFKTKVAKAKEGKN